jgi:PHD/YefM family antitoxin component YafN of YafNO toxin-antitoxin module
MSGVQIPHARLINTKTMEIYTVEEFQERWDEMIGRVENGESIGIINEKGQTAVMIPADEELIRMYTDHEEGS